MRKVEILGAGFSGLVSAYFLQRAGFLVTVHESSSRIGGMIQTRDLGWTLTETAANGILNSVAFETLCAEIGVELVASSKHPEGKRRFIYRRGKARRWPLTGVESFRLFLKLPSLKRKSPSPLETVEDWALRALGSAPYHSLIAPALQGIYAGDPAKLNASLLFGRFFSGPKKKKMHPKLRGTVAPLKGMETFLISLANYLAKKGVTISLNSAPSLAGVERPLVMALPVTEVVRLLADAPNCVDAAQALARVETLPLLSVSLGFRTSENAPEGFGCLFARGEGIRSLGVLFENTVWKKRSEFHLERWILGGATDRGVMDLCDAEILSTILTDREKLTGRRAEPFAHDIKRWPKALPHYTFTLLEVLENKSVKSLPDAGIYLIGNYTGRLGLSGIIEQAEQLGKNEKFI
ncbi:MAG: FAD-dependent oxidoreductase [Cryobacterium sp.]|nr:FAD-dependent oxidoreductase [Oligoflexia bacterium]